jgi:hypothetical protein
VKRTFEVLALLLCVAAIVIMLQPTFTLVFSAAEGGEVLRDYRWFDPLLLGYAMAIPAILLVCAGLMVVGLLLGLARSRASGSVAVPGAIASLLLLSFGYNHNAGGFVSGAGRLVAPLLAVAAVLAAVAWWLGRPPAEEPACPDSLQQSGPVSTGEQPTRPDFRGPTSG